MKLLFIILATTFDSWTNDIIFGILLLVFLSWILPKFGIGGDDRKRDRDKDNYER